MHLVWLPVGLPLFPLDLGPARGVEVSLDARPVRAGVLLSLMLLRELRSRELLARSGPLLPALLLPRLAVPTHHCMLCEVVSQESLRRSTPVRDPPVLPDLRLEKQGRIVEPALGRAAPVTGLAALALAPLPARSQAVESIVGVTSLGRCLSVTGGGLLTVISLVTFALARCLGETGRGPRTATGIALGVTGRGLRTATGLGRSVRVPLLVGEVAVTGLGHAIPLAALMTTRGHVCGRLSPLTARG